ncbi:hypothetical protein F4860DRAFT_416947 [Xylaria cubensis]|nr:hypothetical protein F4860DRAFT_416947 [Xylaria cubensis]
MTPRSSAAPDIRKRSPQANPRSSVRRQYDRISTTTTPSHPISPTNFSTWVKFTAPWLVPERSSLRLQAKVEKQEKAKVPKGRAKKRLQYTRRFVNVTLTGGKRKMNPNPGT